MFTLDFSEVRPYEQIAAKNNDSYLFWSLQIEKYWNLINLEN